MTKYRVTEGTQVHHHGRLYGEGEEVEATEDDARMWLVYSYVEEVRRSRSGS